MKSIKISILVCLFALLFAGNSFSASLVTEDPVNIVGSFLGYNYLEQFPPYWYPGNTVTETIMFVGSEGVSGGYFQMTALINPGLGSCLTDHSQIKEVKAEWLGGQQVYAFSLLPDTCLNSLPTFPTLTETQAWAINLSPGAWQFQAPWRLTLIYDCPKDRKQHKQTREVQSNPPDTIPPKPAGILIEKSEDYFYVSWIGMGTPMENPWSQPWDQRVAVYEDEFNCPIAWYGNRYGQRGTDWWYADGPNRITVRIPTTHAGKTIRFENRNWYGIAPGSPGFIGSPNRAILRTRLPY
jgi:hypothetical protein